MSRPLNYARWDGVDTDSEDEQTSPRTSVSSGDRDRARAAKATSASAATSSSSKVPTDVSGSVAAPTPTGQDAGVVHAIRIYCDKDKRTHPGAPWVPTTIPADHPVFAEAPLPVSVRLGIPLVMLREGTVARDRAELDCQMATYLAIDDHTGFAAPRWQMNVGTVVVARLDRKPLSSQHVEGFWMYNDAILDAFGDAGAIDESHWYGRQQYERWWKNYVRERREASRQYARFNSHIPAAGSSDDFTNVGSPYDL